MHHLMQCSLILDSAVSLSRPSYLDPTSTVINMTPMATVAHTVSTVIAPPSISLAHDDDIRYTTKGKLTTVTVKYKY